MKTLLTLSIAGFILAEQHNLRVSTKHWSGTVSGSTIQIAIVSNGIIFDGSVSG